MLVLKFSSYYIIFIKHFSPTKNNKPHPQANGRENDFIQK